MGIPKFFRWIAERYPLTLSNLSDDAPPVEIDNLYLDMNGIIHNCTHANQSKAAASEEKMMYQVFMYIKRLVRIAKPHQLLFMAIDGVAPRAKMNQQRSRRFKAGKEREEAENKARRLGEELPSQGLFDSNCITPGTAFMVKLDKHLKFFIRTQMANDPSWHSLKVVYSGCDVPGEGEHKIMEYIRYQKVHSSDTEPNVRHCLYGLDADLILLSLATHEPHFCLLREIVSYDSLSKGQPSREVLEMKKHDFLLMHIGILREYLQEETCPDGASAEEDLERVIDDFVLLCVLVGNDFLPHSPTLDINEGAMDQIFDCYREMLRKHEGYLTCGEAISHMRLESFLSQVAQHEVDTLKQRAQDQIDFEQRRSRGASAAHSMPMESSSNDAEDDNANLYSNAATMMTGEARALIMSGDSEAGLQAYKERMYRKMHANTPDAVRTVVQWYMQGLHWVMQYYYRGVPSWDWYFPYHYAPFLSDMTSLQTIQCDFDQGTPVLPLQQLLMVLPPASKNLLPEVLKPLMLDPTSPIADFYPANFSVDGEGKRAEWEAIVLLPFVEMKRLVDAYRSLEHLLPAEVQAGNKTGKVHLFVHVMGHHEEAFCQSTVPELMASVSISHSKVEVLDPKKPLRPEVQGFVPAIAKGCLYGGNAPQVGWPTLQLISFNTELKAANVNVLGITSRKKTRLIIPVGEAEGAEEAASRLCGRLCFVNFPHLARAKVLAVTDGSSMWEMRGSKLSSKSIGAGQTDILLAELNDSKQMLLQNKGIDAIPFTVFAKVLRAIGKERQVDGAIMLKYSDTPQFIPAALAFDKHPGGVAQEPPYITAAAPFSVGDRLIYRGLAYYGYIATVKTIDSGEGAYHVELKAKSINFKAATSRICHAVSSSDRNLVWSPNYAVARKLGIESSALGRITAACRVTVGQETYDVGLSLRHGNDLSLPGMSRPSPEGKGWQYSTAAVEVLMLYQAKFPWIAQLCVESDSSTLLLADAFPELDNEALVEKARAVQRWRRQSALGGRKLAPVTSSMPQDAAMHAVEAIVGAISHSPVKTAELHRVKPELLISPLLHGVKSPLSATCLSVGDWVACMSGDGEALPPFGAYGVVVAVHDGFADVRTLEKFASGSDLDGRVQTGYGFRISFDFLLSLTTINAADVSQLAAHTVASIAHVSHTTRSPSRSASGAAVVPAVAEPAIPDGTRGFHQHAGHGRGKPINQQSAKATIAALAGPQHHGNIPLAAPTHATSTAAPAAVPDFLQKLLTTPADPAPAQTQASQLQMTEAQQTGTADGQSGSAPPPAAGPVVPDFLRKLLGGPQTQGERPESGDQVGAVQPPQKACTHSRGTPPFNNDQASSNRPIGAGEMSDAIAGVQPADPPLASVAGTTREGHLPPHLCPPSHEAFSRMPRHAQVEAALQSMKELVCTLQTAAQEISSSGHMALVNVLAKDLLTQSLSLDMINSVEDAVCEIAAALEYSDDELELLVVSAQMIFDQARHSLEDVAYPGLRWLQHRILVLLSKVESRCLAVMSHAGDAAGQALQPLRVQLRDARDGRLPITLQLIDSCESLLLPAMAACPSLQVRAMTQRTKDNLACLRRLRSELLAEVAQMSHTGAGKLLSGCHAILQARACSPQAMSTVQQALRDAYSRRSFTHDILNMCSSFFQDLARRQVGNTHEMLQELVHQDMLLTISDHYSIDHRSAMGSIQAHTAQTPRQISPKVSPTAFMQSMLQSHPRPASPGQQRDVHLAASSKTAPVQPSTAGVSQQLQIDATLAMSPPPVSVLPGHNQSPASLPRPGVDVVGVRPQQIKQPTASGARSIEDWAGEDLIRGLLQNVTRNPSSAPLPPQVQQMPPLAQGLGPTHPHRGQQPPAKQPVGQHVAWQPHSAMQPRQDHSEKPASTVQVDPLDMWSLLRGGQ